ncbi:GHMP family kinase ATP-binding protein, partial [Selenomonas sp. F0473]
MNERTVRVRVPATSANLGPGFDAFGIACTLYNETTLTLTRAPGLEITARGEGAAHIPSDERNIVWKSVRYLLDRANRDDEFRGAKIHMSNRIPLSRGLGSSAT